MRDVWAVSIYSLDWTGSYHWTGLLDWNTGLPFDPKLEEHIKGLI